MLSDVEQNLENPFECQNSAARILGYKQGDLFHKVSYQLEEKQTCTELIFSFDEGELAYLYLINLETLKEEKHSTAKVVVDDSAEYYVETSGSMRLIDLSGLTPGTEHRVQIYDAKKVLDENVILYAMDENEFYEFARQKQEQAFFILTCSGNLITGRHVFTGKDYLFTSLPNDGNWRVSVDGEPAATGTALGTFLCVYAPEGEHEISFLYWPSGLTTGLWMMAASALLLLAALVVEIALNKNENKRILMKKLQ